MDPAGLRPLGIGEILDVAIKIYRARFWVLIKSVAVVLGPVFALSALIRISVPSGDDILVESEIGPTSQLDIDLDRLWPFIAGTLVIALIGFVASQVATGACFKAVSGAYLEEEPDWRESLRFARSKLGSLLWLSFLMAILLVPALLAFLLPAIYLYVAWAVAGPVLLLEDRRGWSAMKRSRELVKGRFWPTLAVLLLVLLLTAVVQMVFLGILTTLVSVTGNEVAQAVADAIGQTASSALTTPLSAAILTVLYFDLRVRKEGFDLELLAHRMGDPGLPPPAEPDWPPRDE